MLKEEASPTFSLCSFYFLFTFEQFSDNFFICEIQVSITKSITAMHFTKKEYDTTPINRQQQI